MTFKAIEAVRGGRFDKLKFEPSHTRKLGSVSDRGIFMIRGFDWNTPRLIRSMTMRLVHNRDDVMEHLKGCRGEGVVFRHIRRHDFNRVLRSAASHQLVIGKRRYVEQGEYVEAIAVDQGDSMVTLMRAGNRHAMAVTWHTGYVSTSDVGYFELEAVLARRFIRSHSELQIRRFPALVLSLVIKLCGGSRAALKSCGSLLAGGGTQ